MWSTLSVDSQEGEQATGASELEEYENGGRSKLITHCTTDQDRTSELWQKPKGQLNGQSSDTLNNEEGKSILCCASQLPKYSFIGFFSRDLGVSEE